MDSLHRHRDYLEGEWRAARAAPLSARKAMLVATLIDNFVDRQFAATTGSGDILEYRAGRAKGSAAVGLVMALCRRHEVKLVADAVAVPAAACGDLPLEDFMVSVYNDGTVQRLQLVLGDGSRRDMLETLREAISALDE
ncbi:MAG TPA: hypothetical protein VGN60_03740 [Devosia sp.]|nr:hypothetical protein [Devosia sp.]